MLLVKRVTLFSLPSSQTTHFLLFNYPRLRCQTHNLKSKSCFIFNVLKSTLPQAFMSLLTSALTSFSTPLKLHTPCGHTRSTTIIENYPFPKLLIQISCIRTAILSLQLLFIFAPWTILGPHLNSHLHWHLIAHSLCTMSIVLMPKP